MGDPTCKNCRHWGEETKRKNYRYDMTNPIDPDTGEKMDRGFIVKVCGCPSQSFCEPPNQRNGFALADGSDYMAILVTAEDFGCVLHEAA
jgi:hypothetical protein